MRVFNVERSVVKVVAHTPAGICPLPVFPPGLKINVEVVDQSQLGDFWNDMEGENIGDGNFW